MYNESNYLTTIEGTIKKRYFERSPYAQILRMDNGLFYVYKVTSGVYFKAFNYNDAIGIRRMISDRCQSIDYQLNKYKG